MRTLYVHFSFASLFALAALTSGPAYASVKCEALFSIQVSEQVSRLGYLEMIAGVPHEDRLVDSERASLIALASSNALSIDALYGRYDQLSSLLRTEVAFSVNKVELLKLSATSLVAKAPTALVEKSIREILKSAGNDVGNPTLRKLQIPHTVVLKLVEAQLRLQVSSDHVTSVYNRMLATLRRRANAAEFEQVPAVLEAVAQTLKELE